MSELSRYFGVALEESFGELPQDGNNNDDPNWIWFEFASESIGPPDDQHNFYEGASTRAPLYAAPGDYVPEGDVAIPLDIEQIGYLLYGVLGDVVTTEREEGDPATGIGIFDHEFSPKEELPTFRLAIGKEKYRHDFTGATIDELTLQYEDNFVVGNMSVITGEDKKATGDYEIPVVCDLPEEILTSLMTKFTRDSSDITPDIEQFTLTISNNLNVEDGVPAAERFPVVAFPEALEISIDLNISFTDMESLTSFWGGSDGPTAEVNEEKIEIEIEKTEDEEELNITIDAGVPQSYSNPVEGRGKITQEISYSAKVDKSGTGKAIDVTLTNGHEGYELEENGEE